MQHEFQFLTDRYGRLYIGDDELGSSARIEIEVGGAVLYGTMAYSHGDVGRYSGWYFSTSRGWCPLVHGMKARRSAS